VILTAPSLVTSTEDACILGYSGSPDLGLEKGNFSAMARMPNKSGSEANPDIKPKTTAVARDAGANMW